MRLTRLEITGFKSFGERTILSFQPGITAIVGPNGCGKSNIADAILWCLGEQSPKTLRGDRMEDVLFNGSAQRAPTGLAEVALTLSGVRRGELDGPASEYTEITITRRLYRSGESEYLINRVPCRLKDVRDLLIETGAGAKGHTVLEQGKVDAIINASPLERRALIEETAGITKYKIRKTEALRKLDSTEQNLLRVRDIMGEVKRQLSSLDRQAKKAERYRQTYDELKALELRVAATRFQEWSAQAAELSSAVDRERVEEARLLADRGSIEAAVEARKAELGDLDRHHQEAQAQHVGGETCAQDARHRLDFLAAQTEEWRGQREALATELEALARALVDRRDEAARCAVEWKSAEAATKDDEALVASREEAVQAFEQHLAHATADIEQTRHRTFQALSGIAAATNALTTLASRREELEKRRARYEDESAVARAEILQKHTVHQNLEAAHQLHAQSLASREAERAAVRDASVGRQAALYEGEAVLTARRDDLTRLRATLDSLAALQRDLVGYDEGVRHVLHGGDPTAAAGLLGVVADVLDIPPHYERAIEAVLADRLQGVVAEGHNHIMAAVAVLDAHNAGRATFVPRFPRLNATTALPDLPARSEIHGAACGLVGCRPGFEDLRAALLDRVVIVTDRTTARQCWEDDRHGITWVSVSGEVFAPSGVVSGGAGPRAGLSLLERKRTIKALEVDVKNAEDALAPLESSVAALRATLDADRRTLGQLDDELREGELRLVHDQKAAEAVAQEILQLDRRLALLSLEEDAAGKELAAMAVSVAETESALSSHEDTKAREERSLLAQYETASRLKGALAEATGAVTDARLGLATRREKIEYLASTRKTLADRIDEITRQLAAKQATGDQLDARLASAVQERDRVTEALRNAESDVERFRQRVAEVGEARSRQAHRIRELEDAARVTRREVDALQQRLQAVTVSQAETRLRVSQQVDEILDRYHVDLAAVSLDALPPPPCDPDQVDAAVARLKDALAQLGGVNLSAIDEYRELEERHSFLAAQEADLTQSVANLHAAIAKINETTRDLFLEAFHALNGKFGVVYQTFFEGGHAELRLADDGDPLECGIDIVAQPPGKKLRHISLLSGGEKALTAISLLFSSFLIHPSPFCVLDEIDAPLDEENVRRFTRALRPMTAHSQFLVVTHNRRTMEQADVLYGVTMEEPGVSKLVSVKLHTERTTLTLEVETETEEISI
jgi:chromosome segregation protein